MTLNVSSIYKRTEVIGRGKFGIVYKGIHRITKQVYAVKVLNLDTSEDEVKDVQQEIQFLSSLKQVPNITRYYGSYLNGTKLWIIMDYCAGGSLRTLLKPGRLEEKYIGVIVRELLVALQYIHKQNVIHRDIKAANVLITNEGKVQLCDFGVAAQLTATSVRRNTMAGTPYWMAPEVIMEGTSYDVKADIWSLGITIYEIATGNPPYCDKEAMRAMQLITKSKPPRLDGKQYSPLLKEMIALCLDENPIERLSAEELLKTKFVKFNKNSSTVLLKELISRYLLWREKKSSRESILMNVEDDQEEQEIEVKWDFDSLRSNDYILENDINLNNIHLNDENNESSDNLDPNDYDDGVDQFLTGYKSYDSIMNQGTMNFNTNQGHINQTTSVTFKNNTVTNIGSTLRNEGTLNRKEAPKSLLQLFEETQEDEDEDETSRSNNVSHSHTDDHMITPQFELPKIPSSSQIHNGSNSATGISTPRVSTPIMEIEIPNFDDIPSIPHQQQHQNETRSRANTLLHSQSAAAVDTKKSLDPGLPRKPTMSSASVPQLHQTSTSTAPLLPLQPAPMPPTTNTNLPNIPKITPSPKRDSSHVPTTTSPTRLVGSGSSPVKGGNGVSMKAIQSPNNQSPLLQPLNSIPNILPQLATNSTQGLTNPKPSQQAPSQQAPAPPIKRNHQNLRLQMPTPTTSFPKLLHTTSNISETNNVEQDENVNQFGVNVSSIPMAMTPLAEKPLNSSVLPPSSIQSSQPSSVLSKRKLTLSGASPLALQQQQQQQQQPRSIATPSQVTSSQVPFLTNREASNASSHSSHEGISITTNTSYETLKGFSMPTVLDTSLFFDSDNVKERLLVEISGVLGGLSGVLSGLEESLLELV